LRWSLSKGGTSEKQSGSDKNFHLQAVISDEAKRKLPSKPRQRNYCNWRMQAPSRKIAAREKKYAILRRVIPLPPPRYSKWAATLAGLLLTSPLSIARPQPAVDSFRFEAIPLERSQQNHLLVRAFINDKPALLGVDTGAPVSAIAISRRKHFGLTSIPGTSKLPTRLQINGAFNSVAIAHNLRLGALTLIDEPMVVVDLSGSSRAARVLNEHAIDGILGADILFPTSAIVDCQAQMLILKMDPRFSGRFPGFDFRGLRSVPIHVSKNYNLYVDGTINGTRAQLMVDTGAFATLMHRRFIRHLKIPLRDTPYTSAGVNLSQRGVQLATINRFSIGKFHLRKKEVGVMDLGGLIREGLLNAEPPVAGLLGSEILQRHHGIIDFGTLTLYLGR
jgi:predicted aspartyl protease